MSLNTKGRVQKRGSGIHQVNPMPHFATTQEKVPCQNSTSFNPIADRVLCRERKSENDDLLEVPAIVHEVLNSPGQPLDTDTREYMEPRFGHDFANVRVHTDAKAADSAHAVHAHAYTVGDNMVFGPNQFAPATHQGRELLAHELAHTIQQDGSRSGHVPTRVSESEEPVEIEAHAAAVSVAAGRHFVPSEHAGLAIYRDNKKRKRSEEGSGERKTFLQEGFTGREPEAEARLIAASKGWVVQGAMYWNGRNWIGQDVRPGTGSERAVAQVQLDLQNLGEVSEGLGVSETDIGEGFEGTSVYTGEEKPYERKFGQGESKTGEGEGKEGKQGEAEGEEGSKEEAMGTEGTGTGTGANELDPVTALSSFLLDPSSLSELKKNTTGESGSPAGGIGFIKGPLAKVLTVFAAALSIFTGPVLKLLGKLKGLAGKALGFLGDKFRRLFGMTPKTLPPGSRPPLPPPAPEPVPEPIVDELTAPIRPGEAPSGEVVGDYLVNETKGLHGNTYVHEIWGIKRIARTTEERFEALFRTFMQEARAAGASRLQVIGRAIRNWKVFRNVADMEGLVRALGGEVNIIDDMTVEITIPL